MFVIRRSTSFFSKLCVCTIACDVYLKKKLKKFEKLFIWVTICSDFSLSIRNEHWLVMILYNALFYNIQKCSVFSLIKDISEGYDNKKNYGKNITLVMYTVCGKVFNERN